MCPESQNHEGQYDPKQEDQHEFEKLMIRWGVKPPEEPAKPLGIRANCSLVEDHTQVRNVKWSGSSYWAIVPCQIPTFSILLVRWKNWLAPRSVHQRSRQSDAVHGIAHLPCAKLTISSFLSLISLGVHLSRPAMASNVIPLLPQPLNQASVQPPHMPD